jgi:hypothetical protein
MKLLTPVRIYLLMALLGLGIMVMAQVPPAGAQATGPRSRTQP